MKKYLNLFLIILSSVVLFGCESSLTKVTGENSVNKEEKVEEENIVKEELELTDSLVIKYYDLLRDDQGEYYSSVVSKKSTKVNELTDAQKLNIAARLLSKDEVKEDKYNNVSFTRAVLDKHVKEVFGSDTKLDYSKLNEITIFVQRENSPIKGMYLYGNYNSKNDTYNMTWGGIGSSCGFEDCTIRHSKLVDAYTEGEYLYITEKQIFLVQDWNQNTGDFNREIIYKDIDKKVNIGTIKKYNDSIDSFYDKGTSITLVFKKAKDNYLFVESKVGE